MEERAEKHLARAEMEAIKAENLMEHHKEIHSRPKRDWFQTERDKKIGRKASLKASEREDVDDLEDVEKIADSAGVGQYADEFQRQLYSYLNAFTDGAAGGMVMTLGWEHAFEAWRRFADRGRSRRLEHVHHLMTSVMQPKQVAKLADLDAAIVVWEARRG